MTAVRFTFARRPFRPLGPLAPLAALAVMAFGLTGCATAPKTEAGKQSLEVSAQASLAKMQADAPNLRSVLDTAYGYAIFPDVGSGAFILGGAYGRGEVFEQGQFVGFADITKVTVGLQAGGKSYDELIVFKDKASLDNLKYGALKFAADASAVAVKAGVGVSANYRNGVAVFTRQEGGLMVQAAVGGQEFSFQPSNRNVAPPAGPNANMDTGGSAARTSTPTLPEPTGTEGLPTTRPTTRPIGEP